MSDCYLYYKELEINGDKIKDGHFPLSSTVDIILKEDNRFLISRGMFLSLIGREI